MDLRRPVIFLTIAAGLCHAASAQDACNSTGFDKATVAAVRDGRTLALADGRELRLAGIEAGDEARSALDELTGGKPLRLARLGAAEDRYGRIAALAFPGDAAASLQQLLLAKGLAQVSARIGDKPCADLLLATEAAARKARIGLWADPNFAPLPVENLAGLQAKRGQFALVEGHVLSVRESGASIYVNFGRRWTRDFTVVILKRQQRIFAAAGLEPKRLEGHRVRVRGWIELRGGPVVMAEYPEQIERID
jgi:endonuclease YncB( thermonuclease family)